MKLYEIASIRTNNFTDNEVMSKFENLWQQTIQSESSQHNDDSTTLYGVYHEYQSNYQGDYTCSTASETISKNRMITIPDNHYQVFPCTRETVAQTWQQIWQLEQQGQLQRLYHVDYEKYLPDGKVEIHIGIDD